MSFKMCIIVQYIYLWTMIYLLSELRKNRDFREIKYKISSKKKVSYIVFTSPCDGECIDDGIVDWKNAIFI